MRESFNCISLVSNPFPDDSVPELRKSIEALVPDLVSLAQRLLKCLSLALGMEENFLAEKHKYVFKDPELNSATFRTLYYPPLTGLSEDELSDGVVRCGQHADYSTMTLLMQDDMGGLEVISNGKWIPADPIPGALLINVGKLTELLTSDRYVATVHRVRVPEEEIRRQTYRQSATLFLHPDDAAMYSPLEHFHVGKPPFEPVRAKDHLEGLLFNSYKY